MLSSPIKAIHSIAKRFLCTASPYSMMLCVMNKIAERPKQVYISALYLRKVGPKKRGLRVKTMQPVALQETCGSLDWYEGTRYEVEINLLEPSEDTANLARR